MHLLITIPSIHGTCHACHVTDFTRLRSDIYNEFGKFRQRLDALDLEAGGRAPLAAGARVVLFTLRSARETLCSLVL